MRSQNCPATVSMARPARLRNANAEEARYRELCLSLANNILTDRPKCSYFGANSRHEMIPKSSCNCAGDLVGRRAASRILSTVNDSYQKQNDIVKLLEGQIRLVLMGKLQLSYYCY